MIFRGIFTEISIALKIIYKYQHKNRVVVCFALWIKTCNLRRQSRVLIHAFIMSWTVPLHLKFAWPEDGVVKHQEAPAVKHRKDGVTGKTKKRKNKVKLQL